MWNFDCSMEALPKQRSFVGYFGQHMFVNNPVGPIVHNCRVNDNKVQIWNPGNGTWIDYKQPIAWTEDPAWEKAQNNS